MQRKFFMRLSKLHFPLAAFPPRVTRHAEANEFSGRLLAATALVAACWIGFSLPAEGAQQILKGHVPPITKRLTPMHRLDSKTRLDLTIGLPLRNREKLTNLLQELYQPSSAN